MAPRDRRDLTVLVLGGPGATSRRYRIRRRLIALLVIAMLCAALGVGYVLGNRSAQRSAVASDAGADSPVEGPVLPAVPALSAKVAPAAAPVLAVVDAGAPAPVDPLEGSAAAPPVATVEGAATGEPLRILRDGQGQEVIELHPFAADGTPRASDFDRLETEMACGSGHRQKPDVALVRVLLAAQQHFGKPIVLIGGRCPAHDDRPDSANHHRAGRAVDVRVRGVSSEQLMSWLVERGVGGAGRYRRAGFVHIDVRTGPREQWEAQEAAPERPKPKAAPSAAPSAVDEAPIPSAASEAAAPEPPPASAPAPQDDAPNQ
jgi:zinc D-Ala-D-Ala carboxypeptidase